MRTRRYVLRTSSSRAAGVAEPSVSDTDAFGDGAEARRVYTVTELTARIQDLLEGEFTGVWVEGEVSQMTVSTKGHMYFSLKDANALIRCVVWRDARERIPFKVEQGLQVVCLGRVSVYAQRGDYQLYVDRLEPKGMGALQLAFEQLKEKLQKEGLFAEERKRPLPAFPERVGIVTSPRGAAIDDMLKVFDGAGPAGRLRAVLYPSRVQGAGAAEAVARGIRELNQLEGLDLLIVGRGGGSLEDLWAFNEEPVARAIFQSRLPVISAVGHEKDVTISDLVADVRAATPTKAAEIVLAQRQEALDRLLAALEEPAFTQPEEWLAELSEKTDELAAGLLEGLEQPLLTSAHRVKALHGELLGCSPQAVILHQAERLHRLQGTLVSGAARVLEQAADAVHGLAGRLHALSPLAVLARGYSITFDGQGRIVKRAGSVRSGDTLQTRLHRGRITSRVERTE